MEGSVLGPIDVLAGNHVNEAFTKVGLQAMDHILWCSCLLILGFRQRGDFSFKLRNGGMLDAAFLCPRGVVSLRAGPKGHQPGFEVCL